MESYLKYELQNVLEFVNNWILLLTKKSQTETGSQLEISMPDWLDSLAKVLTEYTYHESRGSSNKLANNTLELNLKN